MILQQVQWGNSMISDLFDDDPCCWKCSRVNGTIVCTMILCPLCGNKRCPKASDHTLNCTNSNETKQKGSEYQ